MIWQLSGAFILLLFMQVCSFPSPSEGSSLERITLMTSGRDCSSHQHEMIETLDHMDGVVHIEAGLIPGHLMIDQAGSRHTAEELATSLNRHITVGAHCHVDVMKSCITATAGASKSPPDDADIDRSTAGQ